MWRYFCNYFPIKLVKTAELDAKRNYLLCAYPHGIISTGAFGAFGTEAAGVGDVFPGMESVLVTLPQHFSSPFVRDLALGVGELASAIAAPLAGLLLSYLPPATVHIQIEFQAPFRRRQRASPTFCGTLTGGAWPS